MRRKQSGFTLIELLVVIAIIALLMGILMPVLGRARKSAWGVACMSNMRQIGLAANVFAEDNDGKIPRGASPADGVNVWFTAFMPYLGTQQIVGDYRTVKIFRCPAYPVKTQTVCFVVDSMDLDGPEDKDGRDVWGMTRLSQYTRLAQSAYLADNEWYLDRPIILNSDDPKLSECDVWHRRHLPDSVDEGVTSGRRVARDRHRQGCNVLFADWHVIYVDAKDMAGEEQFGARAPGIDMWGWRKFGKFGK